MNNFTFAIHGPISVFPIVNGCKGGGEVFGIDVLPQPHVNPPADITACGGTPVSVTFTGSSGAVFSWTNSNPGIGLPASGTGNIAFSGASSGSPQVGVITVTPTYTSAGSTCTGPPVSFSITINPVPTVNAPPNLTVCAGEPVGVVFSGTGNPTYTWTNSNPAVGLPASGTGNINFNAANVANTQTASISVSPAEAGCTGPPKTFTVTVRPLPLLPTPPDRTVCPGAVLQVNFAGPAGSTYTWVNSNPAIGLSASGSGNLSFTAATSTVEQSATVTVTPLLNGCPGPPVSFGITVRALPLMNQPPDVTACAGDEVGVQFNGGPGATFAWVNSNPATGLPALGNGDIFFSAAAVQVAQTATVTITPSENGCPGTPVSFQLTVGAKPVPVASGGAVGCDTLPLFLHASAPGGPFQYAWSGPGGFSSGLQNPPATALGTYTVTVTNPALGCAATATAAVTQCCLTRAGVLDTLPLVLCGDHPALLSHHNAVLDGNDTLQFILYTNPGNPLGSILAYAYSPAFPFLPGLTQVDSTYYTAAIAGNRLAADSIDRGDPCFSLFKGPPLRWVAKPTITAVQTPATMCTSGCVDVTFEFTGTPPFQFTWLLVQNGQVLFSRNEVSDTWQKTVTACPADFDLPLQGGNLNFQVNFFMDKFCGCGD